MLAARVREWSRQWRDEGRQEVIEALIEWLQNPEQSDMGRAFDGRLRQVLLLRRMPDAEVPEPDSLQEIQTLLGEREGEWSEQWRQEGRRESSQEVIEALNEWLQNPEQSDVRRAFVGWLRQVLLPRRMPEAEVPELENSQEVKTMLAERVREWTEQWRQEGREEGQEEGRVEELHRTILRQGRERFGEADEATRQNIEAIRDIDALEELCVHLIKVSSWGELLA